MAASDNSTKFNDANELLAQLLGQNTSSDFQSKSWFSKIPKQIIDSLKRDVKKSWRDAEEEEQRRIDEIWERAKKNPTPYLQNLVTCYGTKLIVKKKELPSWLDDSEEEKENVTAEQIKRKLDQPKIHPHPTETFEKWIDFLKTSSNEDSDEDISLSESSEIEEDIVTYVEIGDVPREPESGFPYEPNSHPPMFEGPPPKLPENLQQLIDQMIKGTGKL